LKTVRPSDAWIATNTGGSNAQSLNLGGDMLVGSTQERTQGFWVADADVVALLGPSLVAPSTSMASFGSQLMTGIIVTTQAAREARAEREVQVPALSLPDGTALVAHVGRTRPLQATGRPRKPITEEEIAVAIEWYRAHGTLPTQSGLIKGKVLDHCLSTERALRLLGEIEQRIIKERIA
jgi:hypothetical protein